MDRQDEKLALTYRATREVTYFTQLWKRYYEPLVRHAQFLAASDPEGVVNTAFAAFNQFCLSDQPMRPVQAWLYKAVRLRSYEQHRQATRQKRISNPEQLVYDPAMSDNFVEQHDLNQHLCRLITDLPAPQSEAIRLVYFTGTTVRDAAQQLNVSMAQLKRRIKTGLQTLTFQLGES
jgi:RNA polymerase sigma factor (sigma-70 family)